MESKEIYPSVELERYQSSSVLGCSAICSDRTRYLFGEASSAFTRRIKAPDRTILLGQCVAPTEDNWVDKALLRLLPYTANLRSRLARPIAETDERVTLDRRPRVARFTHKPSVLARP